MEFQLPGKSLKETSKTLMTELQKTELNVVRAPPPRSATLSWWWGLCTDDLDDYL